MISTAGKQQVESITATAKVAGPENAAGPAVIVEVRLRLDGVEHALAGTISPRTVRSGGASLVMHHANAIAEQLCANLGCDVPRGMHLEVQGDDALRELLGPPLPPMHPPANPLGVPCIHPECNAEPGEECRDSQAAPCEPHPLRCEMAEAMAAHPRPLTGRNAREPESIWPSTWNGPAMKQPRMPLLMPSMSMTAVQPIVNTGSLLSSAKGERAPGVGRIPKTGLYGERRKAGGT